MINKLIMDTLRPVNVSVSFQKSSSTTFPYITFFEYLEQGEAYSDDVERNTGHYIQVDIWAKEDYTILAEQVILALEQAGFKRQSSQDLYESSSEIYHKAIRFFYFEEKEW